MRPAGLAQPHQKQTQGRVSSQSGAEVGWGLALFAQVRCEPEGRESGGGGSRGGDSTVVLEAGSSA